MVDTCTNGNNDHMPMDRNGRATFKVEYSGNTSGARAQLVVIYSGGKTKTVSLVGKSQDNGTVTVASFLNAGVNDKALFRDGSRDFEAPSSLRIRGTSTPEYFRSHRWSRYSFKYLLTVRERQTSSGWGLPKSSDRHVTLVLGLVYSMS